jgi:hypothetical protein
MIKNLTPHNINLVIDGKTITFEPDKTFPTIRLVANQTQETENPWIVERNPDMRLDLATLPPPEEGVLYIVSTISAVAIARETDRSDFLVPGTDPADNPIRNEEKQIIAVRRLVRFTK